MDRIKKAAIERNGDIIIMNALDYLTADNLFGAAPFIGIFWMSYTVLFLL